MDKGRKIIVAVTGASGSIYARLLVAELLRQDSISELALVFSANGRAVAEYEKQMPAGSAADPRIKVYDNGDMFSPPASGSAGYDAMVVVPCSMGTLGRVAGGVSGDLIARSADVMLKERRTLIMAVREAPYGTLHLRNMTALSECGAIVVPCSPSFYSAPATIEELCMTVVERIISLLGFDAPHYCWGEQA